MIRIAKKVQLLLLIATLALSAALASGASAAEGNILGSVQGEVATGASTGVTLEARGSAIVVKSTSSEGAWTMSTETSGLFDELLLGDTAAGAKCTGLSDSTTGSILVKGNFELLSFLTAASVLDLAIVLTLEPVHFECLGILTEVKGSVIGLITDVSGSATHTVHISFVGSKGTESITSVNGVEHRLLSETNGGAFVEMSLNGSMTVTMAGTTQVTPMF